MIKAGRPRRWQWVIGVLALLLAAAFVFKVRQAEKEALRAAATSSPLPRSPGQETAAPLEAAEAAETAGPVASAAEGHGAVQVETCGGRWATPAPDGQVPWAAVTSEASQAALRQRAVAAMRASPAPFAQAAALVESELFKDADHRAAAFFGGRECRNPACGYSDAAAADVARTRDRLARMAVSTTDPKLYSLALDICGLARPASEGVCRMLNPAQWARLEPGNAAPWLTALDNASNAGDRAGGDEALHQIATATRNDRHLNEVSRVLMAQLPDDDASLPDANLLALQSMSGTVTLRTSMAAGSALGVCKVDALRDANRAQTCDRVAELFVGQSDTTFDYTIGIAIGKRLGWPRDRIDELRGQRDAWMYAEAAEALEPGNGSCARLNRNIDRLAKLADLGEMGSMHRWIAASGRTPANFIEAQRATDEMSKKARVVEPDQPLSNQIATQSSAPSR